MYLYGKKIIFLTVLLFLFFVSLYFLSKKEEFTRSDENQPRIGQAKTVQKTSIQRKLPNMILPLRKHVHFWTVGVPLTPFKAPLYKLPPLDGMMPNFLLYKPNRLTPVRNQGDCGSCWAFATVDMLADRIMLGTGGAFDDNLSVQQLMTCSNPDGCEGGSPEEACLWLSQTGKQLNLAKKYPYKQGNGGVVIGTCPQAKGVRIGVEPGQVYSLVEFQPEKGFDPDVIEQNVVNMKRELIEGGPFYCAMTVYDDLFSFSGTRVYQHRPGANVVGGHAIEIIGFCDEGVDPRKGFEKGYWVCRNSWGKDWPLETVMDGYFCIAMGENECGVESRSGFANPFLYGRIPKDYIPEPIENLRWDNIKDYLDETE